MSNKDRDFVRLKHLNEAIQLIIEFTHELDLSAFTSNKMAQAAVMREFEIIGEASKNISVETQNLFPNIPWRLMGDFRNLLIHEYFMVDIGEVWATVQNDIPALSEQIKDAIRFLEQDKLK